MSQKGKLLVTYLSTSS